MSLSYHGVAARGPGSVVMVMLKWGGPSERNEKMDFWADANSHSRRAGDVRAVHAAGWRGMGWDGMGWAGQLSAQHTGRASERGAPRLERGFTFETKRERVCVRMSEMERKVVD
jgi:hypothetical protein